MVSVFPLRIANGVLACRSCRLADKPWARLRGLLGRAALAEGAGLLIRPANSVHTAFMRFPIDVVFLSADLTVIRIVPELKPFRAASCRKAKSVLELAAGAAAACGLSEGQLLEATS